MSNKSYSYIRVTCKSVCEQDQDFYQHKLSLIAKSFCSEGLDHTLIFTGVQSAVH